MRFVLAFSVAVVLDAQNFGARFEEIRKAATPREMYAFFWDMPKGGDIHHHLSLSFRPEEVFAVVPHFSTRLTLSNCPGEDGPPLRYRMASPSTLSTFSACAQADFKQLSALNGEEKAAWISAMTIDKAFEGRNEFFEVIVARLTDVARDPDAMRELLARLLKRYAREGLTYLETQYNAPSQEAADKLRRRLAEPDLANVPTKVRFQSVAIRFLPAAEEMIERLYAFNEKNRDLWVGMNMAGREDNTKGHALRFLHTFRKMRRKYSGIHLSIHGGEVDAPGHEVRNTLLLGAERIGHGTNLISDPDTMLLMRNGRNLVEINLVSNRLLEYFTDLADHPFPEYLRFGIPVCLNTDDSGVWDSNLTDEYALASSLYNLTWGEIVQIGRNSLQYSFAEPALKQQLLDRFNAAIAAFEKKYAAGDWKAPLSEVKPEVSRYATRAILR